MKIYNQAMMEIVKDIFKDEIWTNSLRDDEEFCEFLYRQWLVTPDSWKSAEEDSLFGVDGKFRYINEGSDRAAYRIKDTQIIVKFSGMESDDDLSYYGYADFQTAVEIECFENQRMKPSMTEIYGVSDNYLVEFCEYCPDNARVKDLYNFCYGINEDLDEAYERISEYTPDFTMEMFEDCYLDEYDEIDEILKSVFSDFSDIHAGNIGITEDGKLKVIDAGWGDSENYHCEKAFEKLLHQTDYFITSAWHMEAVNEELYEEATGRV